MNEFDIPIFKKSYDLYKLLHSYRNTIPKTDRYTVFERAENALFDVIENIFQASGLPKEKKLPVLQIASNKLNLLRVLVRLMKDTKTLDNKKYVTLQTGIDEIGRMLGGWIKSLNS